MNESSKPDRPDPAAAEEDPAGHLDDTVQPPQEDDSSLSETLGYRPSAADGRVSESQHEPGRVFGNYELLEMIGRGAMGVVYRARQEHLNRIVAVKMIRSQVLATEEDIQRFYIEARAAGQLGHPNIVTVYEMGEVDGQQFFSMDYVEGTNLLQILRAGALPPERIGRYMQLIAAAVHYAHQRGILHRDLKPANIVIDTDDQPHITDFGLAKQVDDDSQLTRDGAVLGTPSYMSPEQASGRHQELDVQSDVYSLGAILYELLTGRPPFRGDSVVETLLEVMERDPEPPRDIDPTVDRDLEAICLKCLQKHPRRRYATAGELADDLDRYLRGVPIRARRQGLLQRALYWVRDVPLVAAVMGRRIARPTAWQRRANWAIIVVPLLLLVGAALWPLLPDRLPRRICVVSGTSGGMYARFAEQYSGPLRELSGRPVDVLTTRGSIENRDRLLEGEAHLAIMQAGVVSADEIAAVAPLYYEVVHVLVRSDTDDVESVADLSGKNVSLGPDGSGMRTSALKILSYYEVPETSVGKSRSPFTELLSDPSLDAAIVTTGLDNAELTRLLMAGRFRLIAADDGELALHRPSFKPLTIRPAHYPDVPGIATEGVPTVATTAFLAVRKDETDSLVRTALEALYDNGLLEAIPGSIRRDEAAGWQALPWHPAARAFYESH